jgi:hypothetical protein
MNTLAFAVASAALVFPLERHIDCRGWVGGARTEIAIRITATDGTKIEFDVELLPGSNAESARDLIWIVLKANGCRGHTIGKGVIVLQAVKDSPIRSVEVKSEVWVPAVRAVPAVPKKK